MILVLIIAVIILWIDNSRLNDELKKLKINKPIETKNNINFCPRCGMNLHIIKQNNIEQKKFTENISQPVVIEKEPKKERSKETELEIKNSIILTVGAFLVVISAIIFLTTTWNTSLNIIKTLVIALMYFVFLGFSYIAETYLNVKKASKIFIYIAFSYLPLVFISISLFELLGHYLSFYGPGKYVYLSISSIILSSIYYYQMKKNNDLFFAIGSYIFQILSIILIILSVTSNINTILVGIGIYNILFYYLYNNDKYYYNKNVHLKINQTTTFSLIISILFFIANTNYYIDIPFTILLITLYGNIYYLLKNSPKNQLLFKWIGPILILSISFTLAKIINQGFIIYQLCIFIGIVISYFIDLLLYNRGNIETFITSSITFIFIYLYTFFEKSIIPSYVLLIYYLLLTVAMKIDYKDEKGFSNIFNYMIPIIINICIIDYGINMKINGILLFSVYIISFLIDNMLSHNNKKYYATISIPFTLSSYLMILIDSGINEKIQVLIALISFIIYYTFYHIKEDKSYKMVSNIWLVIMCFTGINSVSLISGHLAYALPIASIITYLLDVFISKEKDQSYSFLQIELIISFVSLLFYTNIVTTLLFIILTIFYVYHNYKWKKSDNWYYIPIVLFNYYLINTITINTNMEILATTSIVISLFLLSVLYQFKKKEYIGMSLLNTIIGIMCFQMNRYISVLLLLLSTYIYQEIDEKRKNKYLGSIYILITLLCKFIINDLGLKDITALNIGIYMLPLILITRTIIYKNNGNYKLLEYFGLIIINYIAICSYTSESDGMIYVLVLLYLTVLGYNKKWGPIFLTSIIYIVINVFLLTRVFWLSIPWWIYILLIGITLIAFAVKNEVAEKEEKENTLKEIAKKINL